MRKNSTKFALAILGLIITIDSASADAARICANRRTGELVVRENCRFNEQWISNVNDLRGKQGEIGPRGPAGALGAQGATGAQGLQGPVGPATPSVSLRDVNGQVVGPVTDFGCPGFDQRLAGWEGATVLLNLNGRFYPLCASTAGFNATSDIYYQSTDCSGDGYTSLMNRVVTWTASGLFAPSFVGAIDAERILYRVDVQQGQQSIVFRSGRDTYSGFCRSNADYPYLAFRIIQEANLSALYPAPLALQ